MRDDQRLTNQLLRAPASADPPAAATLEEVLGATPDFNVVADALVAALTSRVGTEVRPFATDTDVLRDAHDLGAVYHDDAWTWRR